MEQLPEEIKNLQNKWVAINENGDLIEYADHLGELRDKISKLSYRVFIYKVPELDTHFVINTIK